MIKVIGAVSYQDAKVNNSVKVKMEFVEQQLQVCEKGIQRFEEDIKTAADQIDKAANKRDEDRWEEEEKFLLEYKIILMKEQASLKGE